jgi:hypothetical protein
VRLTMDARTYGREHDVSRICGMYELERNGWDH